VKKNLKKKKKKVESGKLVHMGIWQGVREKKWGGGEKTAENVKYGEHKMVVFYG